MGASRTFWQMFITFWAILAKMTHFGMKIVFFPYWMTSIFRSPYKNDFFFQRMAPFIQRSWKKKNSLGYSCNEAVYILPLKLKLQRNHLHVISGVTDGRGGRGRVPPNIFHREFFADLSGKMGQGRKGKKGKLERKSPFEITKICLGSTKMDNFYREKSYFTPGKNRKNWLCPLWKIFLLRPCM